MKPLEKTDPLTGEVFTAFRANQVFANDENRIRYNNLKAKELENPYGICCVITGKPSFRK